jgi:hypothetical protein
MNKLDESSNSKLLTFFSRPIVGIAGSIASIIGFALSIYFFAASKEVPELTYFVHPAKAAVVRTGQTSNLSVQFDGQNLTGDVTATQIAFWNAGRKSIRDSGTLQPLIIRTTNKQRILEASLQKTSRNVVGLKLDTSRLAMGEVQIKWNILEQNDGGVLQIVYSGDETVGIDASAVLEGQPTIVRLDYSRTLSTPSEEYSNHQRWKGRMEGYIISIMAALVLAILAWSKYRRRKLGLSWEKHDSLLLLQAAVMVTMAIWSLFFNAPPGPPFGF